MFPGYLILSLGPPLTQLGLWREARILIRPSSALHRRQSRTVSLRQCCLSKQQNKSGGTSGLCSFYLSLTYCCGSTDGSRATSISANDDKWAGWWNFMMTVLRCENKRGVYVQRFLWDFGGKSDYKWIYSTYCPQPPLKTISLRKLSCALFVNEVKTTGAQAHCWHLVCGALLVFSGDGEWEKAAEAITNLHSHKRPPKIHSRHLCLGHYTRSKLLLKSLRRAAVVGGQWVHPVAAEAPTCQLAPQRRPFSSLKVALVSQILLAPYYSESQFIAGKFIPRPCLTKRGNQIVWCITCY